MILLGKVIKVMCKKQKKSLKSKFYTHCQQFIRHFFNSINNVNNIKSLDIV
jgi:hypothetical protein